MICPVCEAEYEPGVTTCPDDNAKLVEKLQAGDILLLHDGHSARTASGAPVVVEVLPRMLRRAQSLGLSSVTLEHATAS